MQTLESLQNRLNSARDLHSVVKTMKAMAAVNIRQYEQSVESVNEYYRTVEMGLEIFIQRNWRWRQYLKQRESQRKTAAIVFGSDQGLCGQFNEVVVSFAEKSLKTYMEDDYRPPVIVFGAKASGVTSASGLPMVESVPLPSSIEAISDSVFDLLTMIDNLRRENQIGRYLLFFNRREQGASYKPEQLQLLPFDREKLTDLEERKWSSRCLPAYYAEPSKLFSHLIRQYLFVAVYRAFSESMASENSARLAAMQAAEKNIEENLDEMNSKYNHLRQSSITSELLDMVAGYEALTSNE